MATTERPSRKTRTGPPERAAPARDTPTRLAENDASLADEQRRDRESGPLPPEDAPTAEDIKGEAARRGANAAISRWPG